MLQGAPLDQQEASLFLFPVTYRYGRGLSCSRRTSQFGIGRKNAVGVTVFDEHTPTRITKTSGLAMARRKKRKDKQRKKIACKLERSGIDSMSLDEYQEVLERLGDEYVGLLTRKGLSESADINPEQLRDAVEMLAVLARTIRAVPPEYRTAMWPSVSGELIAAHSHYQNLGRAIVKTGVAGALDAENHIVLSQLRREVIPSLDLEILRLAGETDPERALKHQLRVARAAPSSLLAGNTVAQVLTEGEKELKSIPNIPLPPTPKRWTGWGKLFTGMAVAGANIAGGIALGFIGGPLAVGVTLGGVIASCGVGIGGVCEGVGALRGE